MLQRHSNGSNNNIGIGLENSSTESADDSSPVFPVEGDVAEPCLTLNVRHACSTSAARADSGRRLTPPDPPLLIDQKAEKNHILCGLLTPYRRGLQRRMRLMRLFPKMIIKDGSWEQSKMEEET